MPKQKGGWQEYKGNQPPTQTQEPKPRKVSGEESKASTQTFEYKEHKTLNNLRLVAHSTKGPEIYNLSCNGNSIETLVKCEGYPTYPGSELAKFSPIDGKTLAVVNWEGINLVDIESKKQVI